MKTFSKVVSHVKFGEGLRNVTAA